MRRCLLLGLILLLRPGAALAQQVTESVGSRALGMGGAFVGVADDASATYWNPAGLATGSPAGATIDWSSLHTGDPNAPLTAGATRRDTKFMSLGTWPLGLSYLNTNETYLVAAPGGSFQGGFQTVSLRTSQVNATFLQTVVPGLVVATTLKYVRGSVVAANVTGGTVGAAFDHSDALSGSSSGAFDMDIAAMVDAHWVRVGVTTKNVRQPTFSDGAGTTMSLERTTRVGVAVLPTSGLTLALDVDVNTVDLRDGPRRMLALGGEERIGQRFMVRAGARWNEAATAGPAGAFGGSVLLSQHLWLDAHYTGGGMLADRGWGAALRAGF
jgi:hypothetical protein